MKHILISLLTLLPTLAQAQGENDNWYFGSYAGVNFSAANPVAMTNSQMMTLEACGSISDNNGQLLFYTNGVNIWNRQHSIMQNGSGLMGNHSNQQLVIVKYPNHPGKYFVFTTAITVSFPPVADYIAYSMVDMSLGNMGTNGQPLGDVVSGVKNIPVLGTNNNTFKTEAITAVPHADGVSFWVLIPNGNQLYSYLIDAMGFHPTPVVSNLNFPSNLGTGNYFNIKASPQLSSAYSFSNYICINKWNGELDMKISSFNNSTGQITNDYALTINSLFTYSSEFNKNSEILYLGRNYNAIVYAVNLLASSSSSVIYNEIFSDPNMICNAIQRNKYDDIYVNFRDYNYLSKINNPDVYGGSSVHVNNIYLGGKITQMGLPQLIPGVPASESMCVADTVLVNPETNFLYTYQIGNTILTKDKYTVYPRQNITMKAGKNVTLLPNTYIMNGATYLAQIEDCHPGSRQHVKERKNNQQRMAMFLNLDKEEGKLLDNILVYPNPASNQVTIATPKEQLAYWELYDIAGKMVLKGNTNTLKVGALPKSIYLLRIGLVNGTKHYQKLTVQ